MWSSTGTDVAAPGRPAPRRALLADGRADGELRDMLAANAGPYSQSVVTQFALAPALVDATASAALEQIARRRASRFVALEHVLERHAPRPLERALGAAGTVVGFFGVGPIRAMRVSAAAFDGKRRCSSLDSVIDCGPRDAGEVLPRLPSPAAVVAGDVVASIERLVAPDLAERYAEWSGDRNPIHLDPVAAREAGYRAPTLHGMCTLGIATAGASRFLDRQRARFEWVRARFPRPAYPGDTLTFVYRATADDRRVAIVARNESGIVLRAVVAVSVTGDE